MVNLTSLPYLPVYKLTFYSLKISPKKLDATSAHWLFFSAPVGLMAQVGNAILPEEYKPKKLEDDRKAQEWYVINKKES